ncbi:hypothetical protein [Chrysiogenes arsenatis]|nr:hypothetical protein [Chrysiogenes arsenatis]
MKLGILVFLIALWMLYPRKYPLRTMFRVAIALFIVISLITMYK